MFFAFAALTALLAHKAINDDSYKTSTSGLRRDVPLRRVMLSSTR